MLNIIKIVNNRKYIVYFLLFNLFMVNSINAQNTNCGNTDIYLKGDYIEIGINPNGRFGTNYYPPSDYHPNGTSNNGFGFVANPLKDNWSTIYGDFFTPGTAAEGWGVEIDGVTYVNDRERNQISGCSKKNLLNNIQSSTWTSNAGEMNSKISICQNTSFKKEDLYFTVEVKICNISNSPINEFYYMRYVDPDNDVAQYSTLTNLTENPYITQNSIVYQGAANGKSLISARGIQFPNIYLGLGTKGSNSVCRFRNSQIEFQSTDKIKNIWDGTGSYNGTGSISSDVLIALAFKFSNILPGECKTFSYTYILAENQLDKALDNSTNFDFKINNNSITNNQTFNVIQGTDANLSIDGPAYSWTISYDGKSEDLTSNNLALSTSKTTTYTLLGTSGCNTQNFSFTINILPTSPPCTDCVPSFSPIPGKQYLLSAWVKEKYVGKSPTTYTNAAIDIHYKTRSGETQSTLYYASGPIIDGWQRVEVPFTIPLEATNIVVDLVNKSSSTEAFFDDIRLHPFQSNMKSFVYNPSTQKLTAELDENNYATFYEYDDEGILIRVKKETERGVMTIKETRNNQSKLSIKQ